MERPERGLNVVHVEQLRSKKPHTCKLCAGRIQRGKEYVRRTTVSEGYCTDNRHVHCDALVTAFLDSGVRNGSEAKFRDWIIRNECKECRNRMVCEADPFPFACRAIIERLVPGTVRGAAIQSLEEAEYER